MNQRLQTGRQLSLAVLLGSLSLGGLHAGESSDYQHLIKLKTGDAEVIEADVSELQPGDALSFTTESGQVVDILQGVDGIELYLDGELLATPPAGQHDAAHAALLHERIIACADSDDGACEGQHIEEVHREISIHCISDSEEECDTFSWSEVDDEHVLEEFDEDGEARVFIFKSSRHESETD